MKTLNVNLGSNGYSIIIKKSLIKNLGHEIKSIYGNKKICLVTDKNVFSLYGSCVKKSLEKYNYDITFVVVEPGEASKSMDVLKSVYQQFIDFNLTRSDLVIALGGGVVGDLAGFAASTYLRGIDYVQVPTSLLAQIDSSIGGKVALNIDQGKNLIGSFYQPKKVIIDPDLLSTLPDKFIKDGMAEVIKYACIKDSSLFKLLLSIDAKEQLFSHIEEIIYRCCHIKGEVVENDQYDKGERMLLNFGHTLGHAIERYFNYGYTHGQAVAIGMNYITEKSESLGYTETGTAEKIKNVLDKFNIEYKMPSLDMKKIKDIILLDKKNISGILNLILLKSIGHGFIKSLSIENIDELF